MKPMVFAALLLAVALVAGSTGCAEEGYQVVALTPAPTPMPTEVPTPIVTPTPVPTIAHETHTDLVNGFELVYPRGWQVGAHPSVLFALTSVEICGGFEAAFTLRKIELPYPTDLESFFGPMITLTFSSRTSSFISGEKVGVSGRAAIKWESMFANEGGDPFRDTTFYLLSDTAAWILSFTALSSCQSQYQDDFDYMVDSFRLLP